MEKEKVEVEIDEMELQVAEQMAEDEKYEYEHIFHKAFEYEGKKYEGLHFKWGKLTGRDALAIENEMQEFGKPVIIPSISGEYLIRMAARASAESISIDAIKAMPIRDYNKIRSEARSFFAENGIVIGDKGIWLRKQCLIMSQNNHTSISFWLSLPLIEFIEWVKINNKINAEKE